MAASTLMICLGFAAVIGLTGANSCCSTTCTVWEIEKTMVNRNNVSTAEECKNLCLGSCDFYWSNPNRSICGFYYALNPNVKPCMCSCNATAGETCSPTHEIRMDRVSIARIPQSECEATCDDLVDCQLYFFNDGEQACYFYKVHPDDEDTFNVCECN